MAVAYQILYAMHCGDSAARARRRARQPGCGTAEFKSPRQVPTLNQCVRKARVKNISRTSRVDGSDFKRAAVVEPRAIPAQYALLSQSSRRYPASKEPGT